MVATHSVGSGLSCVLRGEVGLSRWQAVMMLLQETRKGQLQYVERDRRPGRDIFPASIVGLAILMLRLERSNERKGTIHNEKVRQRRIARAAFISRADCVPGCRAGLPIAHGAFHRAPDSGRSDGRFRALARPAAPGALGAQ